MTEERASSVATANPFTATDVAQILQKSGWAPAQLSPAQSAWCEHAAAVLGPQVTHGGELTDLLSLVFHYDAKEILARVETHAVLSRYAARDVLRQLALLLLDPMPLDSARFKTIVTALKDSLELRGRDLFHPIRLALAGRAGEGEFDRVLLLLDEAAAATFLQPVKTARQRIVEFCAALD